ncbi:UNKNOWN [Stylonychia lemnae]|uniref:Kinesin motor domain containing protein n=1 Tax=Stylonychia lemnae TaxID=5949 RepID=A0A077ZSP3_STYLE|nr:UNKNOWN [Stylonychia lemnae]|eukprot:CDW72903.1 UNKNOWN [Stylonychia lemnae]
MYASTLAKIYDHALQNDIQKINLITYGISNHGKKNLILGFISSNDGTKFIDKFSLENQEAVLIGQEIYGQQMLRIKSKEGIADFVKYISNQSLQTTSLIVIQTTKITVRVILTSSLPQIQQNKSIQNMLRIFTMNNSIMLSFVCLDKNTKLKEDLQKVYQFTQFFRDIKSANTTNQSQAQKNNLQSIIQNLPSNILQPKIINSLGILKNSQPIKSSKSTSKSSFQFYQGDIASKQDKPQKISQSSKIGSIPSTQLLESYTCKNQASKRMTTINEQPREDQNEVTTIMSQTDQSLLSDSDTDRISISNIMKTQLNRGESQQSTRSGGHTNGQKNKPEIQLLLQTQEEYQLTEQINEIDSQVKKLKADLHKQQKRSTQKNQKQMIDGIKNQIKSQEEGMKSCQDKLTKVKQEKEQLSRKINQPLSQLQSLSKENKLTIIDLEESEKDKKLREMEEIIKQMSKKLQEKDDIIAETQKLSNISDTIKTLNQKKLLLQSIEVKPNQFSEKLQQNNNISASKINELAFSPTLSRKQLEMKKNQAAMSRQKSGASLSSQFQQLQTLTESSSLAILPTGTFEEKKELKALPDKKKNNSTANLFKWSKPTVSIKIATDDSHNGSISSGNTSIRNNNQVTQSIGNTQVLQQTVSNKISIQNKMSMVSSLTSSNKAHVSRHQSYQELVTEQSNDSVNSRLQKATKKTTVPKKKVIDKDIEKENKKQSKADFQNDEVDEGVQNIKKSIVPIRCINNLIVQETQKRPTSTNSSCHPVVTERSIGGGINSPSSIEAQKKMKAKIMSSKVNEKQLKNDISIFKETSNSHLYHKNRQLMQSSIKSEEKIIVDLTDVKLKHQNSRDDQITLRLTKQETILTADDVTNSSYCNEDIQNTPPKIKLKMSQLASKNKFSNQAQKPKATIDLISKSQFHFNQERGDPILIKSQEIDLTNDKNENQARNNSNARENSITIVQRKERLDTFLRKSFELMTTLRTSADQIAQLKPINRAAIRLQSQERSGIMSTKNACYESQNLNNMQGSFNSQIAQSLDNRKTILFGYSKSPTQQKQVFSNLQNITNDSILEQSRTVDGRQNTTQLNFNSLVEKSMNGLKNYNSSAIKQNNANLKEQIIAKCIRTGTTTQMNETQNLSSTQLRWMNRTLLNKCKSNESLQCITQSQINHAQVERPRSITINQHQSPGNFLGQSRDSNIIKQIDEKNIPKWGELANIIKQNFSPTHSQQNSQQNAQSFQNCMPFEDKTQMNPQKQYLVRHNKIDLSQSVNNQVNGIATFARPPTNPLNVRKRRLNEHPIDDLQNQSTAGNNIQEQNQLGNLQFVRGRSESHYLPGIQNHKESTIRTPREQLFEYNLLNSPNHGLKLSGEQFNSTYYQRRLLQQQSHHNLNQFQHSNTNDNSLSNLFGTQTAIGNHSVGKINLNINTKGASHGNFSSSADFTKGFFTALVSPQYIPEPIGNREKARPEVTELIERQRSRINSQNRKNTNPIGGTDSNYISNV